MPKFDNYKIKVDAALSIVTGYPEGSRITPPEMNKAVWAYLHAKQLVPEKKVKAAAA